MVTLVGKATGAALLILAAFAVICEVRRYTCRCAERKRYPGDCRFCIDTTWRR